MKNLFLSLSLGICFQIGHSIAQPGGAIATHAISATAAPESRSISSPSNNNFSRNEVQVAHSIGSNYAPSSAASTAGHMQVTSFIHNSLSNINNNGSIITNGLRNSANNKPGVNYGAFSNVNLRYNYANKKQYAYYPSPARQNKYYRDKEGNVKRYGPRFLAAMFYTQPYVASIFTCGYFYDDVITYTTPETPGNSARKISFDGYLVYENDTLTGIVTIGDTSVYLEHLLGAGHELVYNISLKNKSLKGIVVYNGDQELYLARPTEDADLARVIHAGKLNIYDDLYCFPTVENMEPRTMFVIQDNHEKSLSPVVVFDVRKPLIRSINKTYGLHLNVDDYTLPGLYRYMSQLD